MARKRNWMPAMLLAAALATGCSKRGPDAVFLVVVDTLRPDRLSCYGYDLYRTPSIDALAAAGVRFGNAESVASWTIPSMGAMMTSLYPTQLGLVEEPVPPDSTLQWRQRRKQIAYTLDPGETTLSELMKEAGYRTAAFVNQPGINGDEGFVQGFDDWYYPYDVDTVKRLEPGEALVSKSWPEFLKNARVIDERLVAELDGWLARNRGERVFVWVHLLTPHRPYNPPPWTARRSSATRERFARTGSSDAYDGEVIAADELVGKVVSLVDAAYGPEGSVVVFASDHGEAFGEHGMEEHGHSLHREVTHVPLIVRAPRAPAGVTVDAMVRTIDILPTILELVGAPERVPEDARGQSLVPLFAGTGRDRLVYAEGMLYGSTERSLLVDGMKLMVDVQVSGDLLYNEKYDPKELVDIAPARAARVDSLRAVLSSLHAELEEDYARRAGGRVITTEESERIQKAMKSLGYVGNGDTPDEK
jgi:arylsulfatase